MNETPNSTDEFRGILKQALALPSEERELLAQLMTRLHQIGAPRPAPELPQAPELTGTSADVEAWLRQISDQTPWDRLQLIEEALCDGYEGEEADALLGARRRLLDENLPVAIRRSVVRIATESPFLTLLGGVGLLIAVAGVGHAGYRLLF